MDSAELQPDFELLFQGIPSPSLVLSPDLIIVAVTDAYIEATMTERNEIIGHHVFDIFPDNPEEHNSNSVKNLRSSFEFVLKNNMTSVLENQRYDVRRPKKDGGDFEERHWKVVNIPLFDKAGKVAYILHQPVDITELYQLKIQNMERLRENAELKSRTSMLEKAVYERAEELVEATRQLQAANFETQGLLSCIVESSDDAIISKTTDGIINSWNVSAERLFGYSYQEAIGKSIYLIIPKDRHGEEEFIRDNVFQGKRIRHFETVRQCKDGSFVELSLTVSPVYDAQGKIIGASKIARDITAEKRAMAELIQSKEQAEKLLLQSQRADDRLKEQMNIVNSIVEHLPVALFAKDVKDNYRWIMWNSKAEDVFDLTKAQVLGKVDNEIFPQEEAEFFHTTDETVMASGQVVDIPEEPITTSRGTWIGHTIKVPIYDEQGNPSVLLGISEDISARKRAETIMHAKEEADRANQAKSDFLANMSHELRTPLNSIIGMTNLLEERPLPDEELSMVNIIHQASSALLDIVNDILDLSKIEANVITLDKFGTDVVSLIERTIDTLKPLASQKKLLLTCSHETQAIPYVLADPARLSRVVTNLVGNAIKYTQTGSIRLETSYQNHFDTHLFLIIKIIDTGIGIAPDRHKNIFDKFTQVDSSQTRKYGGTGLGLAITKELVDMMNGDIHVESEEGQGSTFTVTIPFEITNTLHSESSEAIEQQGAEDICGVIPLHKAQVLVAEDHTLNQAFIRKLLHKFDITLFDIVEDGEAVLAALQKKKYDIILMDCQMPLLNGYDTTARIRALEKNSSRIPIIAMTANAMAGEREKCLTIGMDEYLSKPIDITKLKKVLGRWIKFPRKTVPEDTSVPIDLNYMKSFSDGNKEEERHFVQLFLRQNTKAVEILRLNCVEGKSTVWVETAHLLKSGAASIGAAHLYSLCSQAQEQKDVGAFERKQQLSHIEAEIKRIVDFLQDHGLTS